MSFILAIVGRPNVGKSTLFNRLVGRKIALVDDQPGVTRDLREGEAKLRNLKFKVLDTAGLEDATQETLQHRMSQLSLKAIKESDACLFVIDARQGVTAADAFYANIVRKSAKSVILIANKVEGRAANDGVYEGFSLGLGEPVSISAEHGLGMEDVHFRLCEIMDLLKPEHIPVQIGEDQALDSLSSQDQFDDMGVSSSLSPDKEIQISIIGRPNSGKSTLINQIAGNQRLLTGPEAGITRDAIPASIYWLGQAFRVFDTAGMRKKAKVQNKLEKLSVSDGIRAIRFSEIIVLVLDVNSPLDSQDLRIAALAEREGRCVIIVINKWDLENKKNSKIVELRQRVANLLPQLTGVPLVPISGLFGQGLPNLHKQILRAYSIWNIRVSTARLNSWLIDKLASHPPPTVSGRRIRMRYITQVKSRPPSFVIFTSVPDSVPESYKRYLVNGLRKDFGVTGVPIRLMLRSSKNPYDDKSKKRRVIS